MRNAAGDLSCDEYIKLELETAGIPFEQINVLKTTSEVPSTIIGFLDGWTFRRAWYYWVAQAKDTVLLFEFADGLHLKFGTEIRVAGSCLCLSPKEEYKNSWNLGVSLYHIDTQEGLIAFADSIRKQTAFLNR